MKPNFILNPQLYDLLTQHLKKKEAEKKKGNPGKGIILTQRKKILDKFGLPCTKKYQRIIADILLRKSPPEKRYRLLENTLKRLATTYLSSPAQTNKEILITALHKMCCVDDVLPLMGIPVDCYNAFIYRKLWLKYRFPIDVVLKEFENYNHIPKQKRPCLLKEELNSGDLEIIKDYQLQFMDEFRCFLKSRNLIAQMRASDSYMIF